MKNLLVIVIVALSALFCSSTESGFKLYQSQKIPVLFSYPETWTLEGSTSNGGLISLYSPAAIKDREKSPDLVFGIKIEIDYYTTRTDEIKTFTSCESAEDDEDYISSKPKNEKFDQCYYQHKTDELFIVTTLLQGSREYVTITGYLPEKKDKKSHLAQYNQVVRSISFSSRQE